ASLRRLETDGVPADGLLNVLADAVQEAERAVHDAVGGAAGSAAREGAGTTLTAMLWTGSQLGLVHVGDSRVYLLR
ncbi:hypothetical protein G3I37_34970, partial [Streptomyces anulatus]|nr:hypothetical protein [Streptomyces anulatus]